MTRATVNITTLYSSAQCVLSVVGSVGVILLFAGIPQLIYSPVVSVANLMTFLLGAILITTMVAGNSFLNYKYRKFTRAAQQHQRENNTTETAATTQGDMEDKPPSYEAILSSDGLPPDYFSVLNEKPPKYEDIASGFFGTGTFIPAVPLDRDTTTLSATERPCSIEGVADTPNSQAKGVAENTQRDTTVTTTTVSKKEEPPTVTTQVTTEATTENTTYITINHEGAAPNTQLEEEGIAIFSIPEQPQDVPNLPVTTVEISKSSASLDLVESSSSQDLRESES